MTPEFYLVLDGKFEDEKLTNAVFEAGFDDCLHCSRGNGHAAIWVTDREGELIPLVNEAIAQAQRAGIKVLRVEIDAEEIKRSTSAAKPEVAIAT